MCGGVHDVITGNKFHQNRSRGFRATGVRNLGTPIDYLADCDSIFVLTLYYRWQFGSSGVQWPSCGHSGPPYTAQTGKQGQIRVACLCYSSLAHLHISPHPLYSFSISHNCKILSTACLDCTNYEKLHTKPYYKYNIDQSSLIRRTLPCWSLGYNVHPSQKWVNTYHKWLKVLPPNDH